MSSPRLAVIPARGGSKRIPRKNIRLLAGRPMLVYTVEAALESDCFDRVIVSTDDPSVAEIAQAAGADVPFLREPQLADDHTSVSVVTIDALQRLELEGQHYPVVAQLLPNCPLRDAADVRASLASFTASGAASQISVTDFGWLNPWWAMKLGPEQQVEPVFPGALRSRSQDLPPLFCPNGSIWWGRADTLIRAGTFYGMDVRGFAMAWQHAVDIDDEADFAMAELLMGNMTASAIS